MTDTKNPLSNWLKNNVKKDIPYVFYNGYTEREVALDFQVYSEIFNTLERKTKNDG